MTKQTVNNGVILEPSQHTGDSKMFTIMGYTVSTKEQALSVLLVAKLNGNAAAAKQAAAVLNKLPA